MAGARLAADGHQAAAGALAAAALAAWLAVTCLVPVRLAAWQLSRPPGPEPGEPVTRLCRRAVIADVGGSWYLWPVSTQSLAIVATLRAGGRPGPERAAAIAAVALWLAGAVLYLAVTALVAARLRLAGLGPREPTAPFWVAMGAASITVLAAARILISGTVQAMPGGRAVCTGLAVAFWLAATCLIPPLACRSAWRHLRWHAPLRYRADQWMIIFPAGMYATASMQLGTAARLPALHGTGAAAAWIAAAAWALAFATMIVSALGRSGRTRPGPAGRDSGSAGTSRFIS